LLFRLPLAADNASHPKRVGYPEPRTRRRLLRDADTYVSALCLILHIFLCRALRPSSTLFSRGGPMGLHTKSLLGTRYWDLFHDYC
jgi:hypothetical protein